MMNRENTLNAWDRVMAAITFAEAGEAETAREIMEPSKQNHNETRNTIKEVQEQRRPATIRI